MKKYKYARLYYSGYPASILGFSCTDPELAEEVISELRKMLPQAKLSTGKNSVTLEKANDKGVEAHWWLIMHLCQNGWKPFSAGASGTYGQEEHFRFEYEE